MHNSFDQKFLKVDFILFILKLLFIADRCQLNNYEMLKIIRH